MFHELIKEKMLDWYSSEDCKINNIIEYMEKQDKLRDTQLEAVKTYLFFKIYCRNKPLARLFKEGYFLKNIDLNELPISGYCKSYLEENVAARALYEIALCNKELKGLKEEIENNYNKIDYEKTFDSFFHNTSYSDYIYSLPMGAGKTYLMAMFVYLNLYFALNEPNNKAFAHNFVVFAPSGLKSSIVPSLSKMKDFDVSWIFPEPTASTLKSMIKYEILDEVKTDNKSNKIKNPNVAKIAQYQPYKNMFGLLMITNAEKVILDRIKIVNDQLQFDIEENDIRGKVANELRETIAKVPNLAIFIDEVHHVADEEIKLKQVVTRWNRGLNINEVLGFSGTPYLDKTETFEISKNYVLKNTDLTNVVYHYPLIKGINNFLKKPKLISSNDNNPLNIVEYGLTQFFATYKDVIYEGDLLSKIAIYCGSIKNLEENIYPKVSEIVTKLGMNPNEVILKYHAGNDDYSLPKENELEFNSLNNPISKKRVVLLVGIGKEGWDCSSLTGVILSQKNDCKPKMILQSACRCLRQVVKGAKETALICLNDYNLKELEKRLEAEQHATLEEFQRGSISTDSIERYSRMNKLDLPNISFYKLEISYSEEKSKKGLNVHNELKNILSNEKIKKVIVEQEQDIDGSNLKTNSIEEIGNLYADYNAWLLGIVKGSFNNIKLSDLELYNKELSSIFKKITIIKEGKLVFNELYDNDRVKTLIRSAFYEKRELKVKKEEVQQNVSILKIENLNPITCENKDLVFPSIEESKRIIALDSGDNAPLNIESLSKEELLELVKNPNVLLETQHDQSLAVQGRNKTLHYIPYVFSQSGFEKAFMGAVLSISSFKNKELEIYYNGDRNLTDFRIKCYKEEDGKLKQVGLYTPDFLIIRRENNIISKILIVETKGKGFKNQEEFIDRRNYIQNDFLKLNNKKYGYKKYDYLYIEDTMSSNQIVSKVQEKINMFFKEVE